MTNQSPLLFKVTCSACYGVETWKLKRILRMLSKIPEAEIPAELPPDFDVEYIAEQFIRYSKLILCPSCGKTGVLKVWRLSPS